MTNRLRINLLALTITAVGATSLFASSPAQASNFDGCSTLRSRKLKDQEYCASKGGNWSLVSQSCTSTSYTLDTNCSIQL